MHECLELSVSTTLPKQEVYDQYKLFCQSEKLGSVVYQEFCKRVLGLEGVTSSRPSSWGKREQSFSGVKLRGHS